MIEKKNEPDVHVGILSGRRINFCLNGDFRICAEEKVYSGKQFAEYRDGNIFFDDNLYNELTFTPLSFNDSDFDLHDVTIGKNFHWEQKEKQRFTGTLKIIKEKEEITAVNILPVEDYLVSVISSEMNAHSSPELLKAHAIISRSWLLAQITKPTENKNKKKCVSEDISGSTSKNSEKEIICWYDKDDHDLYDVCADDHCQRYQGITRAGDPHVREAVEATKGQILTFEGKICDARFSKSCGGVTELFENCWEEVHHPYLVKVIDNSRETDPAAQDLTIERNAENWIRSSADSFCNTDNKKILSQVLNTYDQATPDFYRWKVEYSQQELAALVYKRTGINFGGIIDLIPIERGVSGRLVKLKIVGTNQSLIIGKELEIRKILSESHLYSAAFVIDKKGEKENIPESFILHGAGWGHGVGLCQIGAAVMAEKGYDHKQILLHYYKHAQISPDYGYIQKKGLIEQ
jgi:SpoIID/LytB domain protein